MCGAVRLCPAARAHTSPSSSSPFTGSGCSVAVPMIVALSEISELRSKPDELLSPGVLLIRQLQQCCIYDHAAVRCRHRKLDGVDKERARAPQILRRQGREPQAGVVVPALVLHLLKREHSAAAIS
jgi:hypothetical protein